MTVRALILFFALLVSFSRGRERLQAPPENSEGLDEMERSLQSSTEKYIADAYECNELLQRIYPQKPKQAGDKVRICVKPSRYTLDRGALLRRIDSFVFIRQEDGIKQDAVATPQKEAEGTLVLCEPQDEMCVMTTTLANHMCEANGNITGTGEAHLEFEDKKVGLDGNRRLNDDIKFAGTWPLKVSFEVAKSKYDYGEDGGFSPTQVWNDLTPPVQYGIGGIIFICFLFFLCSLLYCCYLVIRTEQEEFKYVDGKVPKDVDVDSEASFFYDFEKEIKSVHSEESSLESEIDPEMDYEVELGIPYGGNNDPNGGGLAHVPEEEEADHAPPAVVKKPTKKGKKNAAKRRSNAKGGTAPGGAKPKGKKKAGAGKKKKGGKAAARNSEVNDDRPLEEIDGVGNPRPARKKKTKANSEHNSAASSIATSSEESFAEATRSQGDTDESTATASEDSQRLAESNQDGNKQVPESTTSFGEASDELPSDEEIVMEPAVDTDAPQPEGDTTSPAVDTDTPRPEEDIMSPALDTDNPQPEEDIMPPAADTDTPHPEEDTMSID